MTDFAAATKARSARQRRRFALSLIIPAIVVGVAYLYSEWNYQQRAPYCVARGLIYDSRLDACVQVERPWETRP